MTRTQRSVFRQRKVYAVGDLGTTECKLGASQRAEEEVAVNRDRSGSRTGQMVCSKYFVVSDKCAQAGPVDEQPWNLGRTTVAAPCAHCELRLADQWLVSEINSRVQISLSEINQSMDGWNRPDQEESTGPQSWASLCSPEVSTAWTRDYGLLQE